MKNRWNDFANDTDADLAAYVQRYRSRIADMTHEIKDKVRGHMDHAVRATIETVKMKLGEWIPRFGPVKPGKRSPITLLTRNISVTR